VLFIVVDDLNLALGCSGDPAVKSPHLGRQAARGGRFDRHYCWYPLGNPGRVLLLSGRRPETSGVYGLTIPARTAFPDTVMLPQFLRQRGFFTAGAEKIFQSAKTSGAASWELCGVEPTENPEEKTAIESRYGAGEGVTPSGREAAKGGRSLCAAMIRASSGTGSPVPPT
jgi:arylsulfatase A-like enzyme